MWNPFILEVFQEDFNTIVSLPMFIDLHATFAMFSFYYAQRPSYLQRIIFPSPNIFECYTEFDAYTIVLKNY